MTSKLAPYLSQIAIGKVQPDGNVLGSVDLIRWLNEALIPRIGGTQALTNLELATTIAELDSEALMPKSDPLSQRAMQAIDEIRNELSSVRSECDNLRNLLAEREAELTGLRSLADMRPRLELLEDRFP